MSRRVLGLDLATASGWVVLEQHASGWYVRDVGTIDATPESKDEPEGVRFYRFRAGLDRVFDSYSVPGSPIEAVGIEQTFSQGYRSAQVLFGIAAVAMVELEDRKVPYTFVHSETWQANLVGAPLRELRTKDYIARTTKTERTRKRKSLIRESLNGWAGIEPGTTLGENEADALGVARWLIENALVDNPLELEL